MQKFRKAAKKADKIYLATDPDREERYFLASDGALKEDPEEDAQITFNEYLLRQQ